MKPKRKPTAREKLAASVSMVLTKRRRPMLGSTYPWDKGYLAGLQDAEMFTRAVILRGGENG